tara:strand:+ start:116 stop:1237 length:1122 start_codon:yes stop_codon:yes gene_type:complete
MYIDKIKKKVRTILKNINELLFLICDSFLFLFLKILPLKNKKNIEKVCVRLDALGDAIIFINNINANNKDKTLYIISNLQEQLFKELKNVENYFVIDRLKFKINIFYRFKILVQIYGIQCNEIINPIFSKEILLEDTIVRFIQSRKKIGLLGNLENSSLFFNHIGNKFYHELIDVNHNQNMHDFHLNYEILKITNPSEQLYRNPINFDSFFLKKDKNNHNYSNCIIIHCGSGRKKRNLPEIYFHKIIEHILLEHNTKIILTGHSSYEKKVCDRIEKKFGNHILNLHGKTSIKDIYNIANSCKRIITNDTFMAHVGYMLDCKTIIFKKHTNNYNRFLPYPNSFPSKNIKKVFLLNKNLYSNFNDVLSSVNFLLE